MSRSRTLEKKLYKSTLKIIIYQFMGMYIKSTGHPSALASTYTLSYRTSFGWEPSAGGRAHVRGSWDRYSGS